MGSNTCFVSLLAMSFCLSRFTDTTLNLEFVASNDTNPAAYLSSLLRSENRP